MAMARSTGKRACCSLAIAFAMLLAQAGRAAAPGDAILGTWLTEDGDSKVEVAAGQAADGGPVYAGKVSWLKDPTVEGQPVRDARNDDVALRSRPIMGLEILSGSRSRCR